MEKVQAVFKRYEKKYLLNESKYYELRNALDKKMTADKYGNHTICNVYFDTEDYYLIRTSLQKPLYKEKLRLRSYGVPKSEDIVFVEIKKKFDGIVYKRRAPMKLKDAEQYLIYGKYPEERNQIINEIDWVLKRYTLKPAVYIAYNRVAMYGNEDSNLRVTFDKNIRFRESSLDLRQGSDGNYILDRGMILMEVKIPGAVPVWMGRLFSELEIFPVTFSKYGICYKRYLSESVIKIGGKNYA